MITKCQKCGREWTPKSKNLYVSCSNCLSKVKVNKGDEPYINMEKKTKIKYVYQKKVLKTQDVCGIEKDEVNKNRADLSYRHNIPLGEINVEFD